LNKETILRIHTSIHNSSFAAFFANIHAGHLVRVNVMWPPRFNPAVVEEAAKQALAFQRFSFFRILRVNDALVPPELAEAGEKLSPSDVAAVKRATEEAADEIIGRHTSRLPPNCKRAPAHLQMAALALAAQRVLEDEDERRGTALIDSKLKMRSWVANACGVYAPPDGVTAPSAVPAMYIPNKIAMTLTGALWLERRRRPMLERMVANFEADLGAAFEIETIEPSPSRRLRRCFYHDLFEVEGEPVLQPVFSAIHETTWAGVPGFRFVREQGGQCSFLFE
jgi:hypothetical protein